MEVSLLLTVNGLKVDILCLTERWLLTDQINIVNTDKFRLVSKFCRTVYL
jgi:hypothetical protein